MTASVCVAIPVKNGERYLAEAVESVLAQEGVDLHVQIIDNGSSDGSVAIAEQYLSDPRVQLKLNERDFVYYGSLNRALTENDCEFFVPFAADDVMRPGNLRQKVDLLEQTGAGLAHSSTLLIDEEGNVLGMDPDHKKTPPYLEAPDFFRVIAPFNSISCQSVVARRSTLLAVGGFDMRAYYTGDWLTWMRVALRFPVATIAEPLVANRQHAKAGTLESNSLGINARDMPATLEMALRDSALPPEWLGMGERWLAGIWFIVTSQLVHAGLLRTTHAWAAYATAARALAHAPTDPRMWQAFSEAIRLSGLEKPLLPFQAIAQAPYTPQDAADLADCCRELKPILSSVILAADPERIEESFAVAESAFAQVDVDVELQPRPDLSALFAPGAVVFAPWGDPVTELAESAGVPVIPYRLPNRFAQAPDPSLWEATDPDLSLPPHPAPIERRSDRLTTNVYEPRRSSSDGDAAELGSGAWAASRSDLVAKLEAFPRFASKRSLARFLVRRELFERVLRVNGSIVECGVFNGAGLFTWAQLSTIYEPVNHTRKIVGFDSFEGFPSVSADDQTEDARWEVGDIYGDSLEALDLSVAKHDAERPLRHIPQIELVQGDFLETGERWLADNPHALISLLYLDFDLYEPTVKALEVFLPRMSRGALVCFDEANCENFPGETKALLERLDLRSVRLERSPLDPWISWVEL